MEPFDLLRFVEGWNFDLYKQLGAHFGVVNEQVGYWFKVWAPNALGVSVLGDFNGFDKTANKCCKDNNGIWSVFISNINKNQNYKFGILTKHHTWLFKADPFAFYSRSYPYFDSVTYDLKNYKWNDNKWMEFQKKQFNYKIQPILIYEIHLASWRKGLNDTGGDEGKAILNYIDFVFDLIPYLKKHHYNYVEFMPLLEHPFLGSWGYQVTGFFSPTARYGKPEELKYLIDQLHQNNIGVIFDFVPVHYCKDDFGLHKFDGTNLFSYEIEMDRENYEWGTANFNVGKHEIQSFLIASLFYWISEFHIDGYRIDAVSYLIYHGGDQNRGQRSEGINFIKNLNSQVAKAFPWVLKIAEDSSAFNKVTGKVNDKVLGFDLKWDLGFVNDMCKFIKTPFDDRIHHNAFNAITFSYAYKNNENYLLPFSHDEVVHLKNSFLNKQHGSIYQKFAGLRAMLGLQIGHPGKKLVFMGTEFGQWEEWNERFSLNWHWLKEKMHQKLLLYVTDLNQFYINESCLYESDYDSNCFEWNYVDNHKCILIFNRYNAKKTDFCVIVHNLIDHYYDEFWIKVPYVDTYYEILNSDNLKYGGNGAINYSKIITKKDNSDSKYGWIKIKLAPMTVLFLKPEINQN